MASRSPLLVISLPRSGSSWVGDTLGRTRGALYLREPFNQVHLARGGTKTLIEVDPNAPPDGYTDVLDRVLRADPSFEEAGGIVRHRRQWMFPRRRDARVVVKEVNPLMLPWILETNDLQVILLVRHPAAVLRSFQRMGWKEEGHDPGAWRDHGQQFGSILRVACDVLGERGRVVRYEDLCRNPHGLFAELADWAGLSWRPTDRRRLKARINGNGGLDPYGTSRDSRAMVDAWRGDTEPAALEALREGWRGAELPLYEDDCDW